ncbi:MAG: hypothetical protein Q9209_007495 [Squamulea sp. 1 TL-2023]
MVDDHAFGPPPPQKQDEDSDWEYEYEKTETESFYVTVDVSSLSQQARAPKKSGPLTSTFPDPETHGGQEEPGTALPIDPDLLNNSAANHTTDGDPDDRIQILDFHSRNPLISYQDKIYSCTWASTIGTDIFLASPGDLSVAPVNSEPVTPMLNLPNVSIIGTSCVNLMARPVTLTPRNDAPQPQTTPTNSTTDPQTVHISAGQDSTHPPEPTSPPPAQSPTTHSQLPKIPLPNTADNTSRAQASFLESLIAVKASKGETDEVTVHAIQTNQGTGWRARRRLAEEQAALLAAQENGDGDDDDEEADDLRYDDLPSRRLAAATTNLGAAEYSEDQQDITRPSPKKRVRYGSRGGRIGRPRGSHRQKRVRFGGLFRDDVPDAGDTVGMDIGAREMDSTPSRWDEVEGRVQRIEVDAVSGMAEVSREGGDGDGDVRMEDVE